MFGADIETIQEIPQMVLNEVTTLSKLVIPTRFSTVLQTVTDPDYTNFANGIVQWLQTTGTDAVEYTPEEDCNRIIARWVSIADACRQITALDELLNEATMRKGVDQIFEASTSQSDAKVRYEESLRLIKSAEEPPSPTAQFDTAITYRMSPSMITALRGLDADTFAQASWRNPPPYTRLGALRDLLMSATEYKVWDEPMAHRQLVYDLSTAQSVRRALSLSDTVLFGRTSAFPGRVVTMYLYACWWYTNTIRFSKIIKQFRVSSPEGCLQFYIFLRNLNERNAGILRSDGNGIEKIRQTLKNSRWRAPGTSELADSTDDECSDYEADRVLDCSGNWKEAEKRDFRWILKNVPRTDWTSQWAKATQTGGVL